MHMPPSAATIERVPARHPGQLVPASVMAEEPPLPDRGALAFTISKKECG